MLPQPAQLLVVLNSITVWIGPGNSLHSQREPVVNCERASHTAAYVNMHCRQSVQLPAHVPDFQRVSPSSAGFPVTSRIAPGQFRLVGSWPVLQTESRCMARPLDLFTTQGERRSAESCRLTSNAMIVGTNTASATKRRVVRSAAKNVEQESMSPEAIGICLGRMKRPGGRVPARSEKENRPDRSRVSSSASELSRPFA